jgi:hypothetical protein
MLRFREHAMSSNDDADSEVAEKKSYSFVGRFIVFLFIAGPASVFAIGIYGRIGLRGSLAAAERGEFSPIAILSLWLLGLLGTAVMIFKR